MYITGTLRADRKQNPPQVVGRKLQIDDMVFMSLGDISITKWKDKRDVCVISNAHVPTMAKHHRLVQTEFFMRCVYLRHCII